MSADNSRKAFWQSITTEVCKASKFDVKIGCSTFSFKVQPDYVNECDLPNIYSIILQCNEASLEPAKRLIGSSETKVEPIKLFIINYKNFI